MVDSSSKKRKQKESSSKFSENESTATTTSERKASSNKKRALMHERQAQRPHYEEVRKAKEIWNVLHEHNETSDDGGNKKAEENKRKKYEGRMKRKAKREGKPLDFYLNQGMKVPSTKFVEELRDLAKNKNEGPTKDELQVMVEKWKEGNHSQHCLMYHLNMCKRGNNCAFLHTDIGTTNKTIPSTGASNKFHETDEVAG